MRITLCTTFGESYGTEVDVVRSPFVIGRANDCDLQLRAPFVSRHHCELSVNGTQVEVRDLGSRNGTFVNCERVQGFHVLENGDLLSLGAVMYPLLIAGIHQEETHGVENAVTDPVAA